MFWTARFPLIILSSVDKTSARNPASVRLATVVHKLDKMIVQLKIGIDNLKFGMTRPEVEEIIGRPNRQLIDSIDDNELIWEYTDLKLRLTFYQNEADRLGYIRSSNVNLQINDSKIIDCKIVDLQNIIAPKSESWEREEYDLFSTYFHKQNWLTLNVEYERITSIELGVPFKNDDEYEWPI